MPVGPEVSLGRTIQEVDPVPPEWNPVPAVQVGNGDVEESGQCLRRTR